MENTGDTGFYPEDAQMEEAVRSLRKRGAGPDRGAGTKRKPAKQETSVRGVRP